MEPNQQLVLFDSPAQTPYPVWLLYRVFCFKVMLVRVGQLTSAMLLLLRHGYCYVRNNDPREPRTHYELCCTGNGLGLLHRKGYEVPVWDCQKRDWVYPNY